VRTNIKWPFHWMTENTTMESNDISSRNQGNTWNHTKAFNQEYEMLVYPATAVIDKDSASTVITQMKELMYKHPRRINPSMMQKEHNN
jgi:hypothetical protein